MSVRTIGGIVCLYRDVGVDLIEDGAGGLRHIAAGRRAHPRARQREGPGGYKLSRSDDAGDVGRDGASEASGTFRWHYAADR